MLAVQRSQLALARHQEHRKQEYPRQLQLGHPWHLLVLPEERTVFGTGEDAEITAQ